MEEDPDSLVKQDILRLAEREVDRAKFAIRKRKHTSVPKAGQEKSGGAETARSHTLHGISTPRGAPPLVTSTSLVELSPSQKELSAGSVGDLVAAPAKPDAQAISPVPALHLPEEGADVGAKKDGGGSLGELMGKMPQKKRLWKLLGAVAKSGMARRDESAILEEKEEERPLRFDEVFILLLSVVFSLHFLREGVGV